MLRSGRLLAGLTLLAGAGCELINPAEDVPAYLHLPRIAYSPGDPQATITGDPRDAWVYVNDKLLGTFELPATVPVLASGDTKVNVYPGVIVDGRPGVRFIYPFYSATERRVTLTPGQTTEFPVATSVDPAKTDFYVATDFQDPGSLGFRQPTSLNGVQYELLPVDVAPDDSLYFAGANGRIGVVPGQVGKEEPFYMESDFIGTLPQRGKGVYAELNYRATMPFQVGISWRVTASGTPNRDAQLTVFPKRTWTKLYVDLTDEVSYVNNPAALFRLTIIGVPSGAAGEYVALDNVRLLALK